MKAFVAGLLLLSCLATKPAQAQSFAPVSFPDCTSLILYGSMDFGIPFEPGFTGTVMATRNTLLSPTHFNLGSYTYTKTGDNSAQLVFNYIEGNAFSSLDYQLSFSSSNEGSCFMIGEIHGEQFTSVGGFFVQPPPNNNNFANRLVLNYLEVPEYASNASATGEPSEPIHVSSDGTNSSVWFEWTPAQSGLAELHTAGSFVDTVVAVYTGSSLASLVPVAENDNESPSSSASRVVFRVLAGTSYKIALGSADSSQRGTLALTTTLIPIPDNDNLAQAKVLTNLADGNNIAALGEPGEPSHINADGTASSVWYSWTSPSRGLARFKTQNSSTDTVLAVYQGAASHASLVPVASNNDAPGLGTDSQVEFVTTAGTTYWIAVGSFQETARGTFRLTVAFTPPPANDNFASALFFNSSSGFSTVPNRLATGQVGEPIHGTPAATSSSLWYAWVAPRSGTLSLDTEGSDVAAALAVYTGSSLASLVPVTNSVTGPESSTHAVFHAVGGTVYRIAVGSLNEGEYGTLKLSWLNTPGPLNDDFDFATSLNGLSGSVNESTQMASAQPGEPIHGSTAATASSLWHTWQAPRSGTLALDTEGSDVPAALAVYTGTSLASLVPVTNSLTSSQASNQLVFHVVGGTVYRIAVGNLNEGEYGTLKLNWLNTPGAINDDFVRATSLDGLNGSANGNSQTASSQPGEPVHVTTAATASSLWYAWQAPQSGTLSLDTEGSDVPAALAVYTGSFLDSLVPVTNSVTGPEASTHAVFHVVAGTVYRIAVGSLNEGEFGNLKLNWLNTPGPINDDLVRATGLSGLSGSATGTNVMASSEPGEPIHGSPTATASSVWHIWTAPHTGTVTFDTLGSEPDTILAVYRKDYFYSGMGNLIPLAWNDNAPGLGGASQVSVAVYRGSVLCIAVGSAIEGQQGAVTLNWSLPPLPQPSNDHFANATELPSGIIQTSGTIAGATSEPAERPHLLGDYTSQSVWFTWTSPINGYVRFNCQGIGEPLLTIFSGDSLENLSPLPDLYGGFHPEYLAQVTRGTRYRIAVFNSFFGFPDAFTLTFEYPSPITSYEDFADRYFTEEQKAAVGVAGPNDDADGDGVNNLLECAFGSDPNQPTNHSRAETVVAGDELRLVVPKNANSNGFSYAVEVSTDLVNWTSEPIALVSETQTELVVRSTFPLSTHPKQYLRVAVVVP